MLGIMLDCSRNAIPRVSVVKDHMDKMKQMGYDTLMLYTEDTFEVEGEPYFGYLRGRYTIEEMKEIVAYGDAIGIEVVPCIQTLAHVGGIFHWDEYKPIRDTADILFIDEERTWTLIENIFKTLRKVFTSNQVHIGMDEAHLVGLGKYYDKYGPTDRFELILGHLQKVCDLCDKHGFKPMMWSDMFFRLACGGDYYGDIVPEIIDKVKAKMPDNITLVYWDYYSYDAAQYERMCRQHLQLCDKVIFANGVWTWNGFTPGYDKAMKSIKPGMEETGKQGLKDVLVTVWGDDGFECPYSLAMPMYFLIAENYRGNFDMEDIAAKFKEMFGDDFNELVSIEDINRLRKGEITNSSDEEAFMSKMYLYNDVLSGAFDCWVPEGTYQWYKDLAERFAALAKTSANYGLEYAYVSAFCDVLSLKADLGLRLRKAYQENDREALKNLAENVVPETLKRLKAFFETHKKLWFKEKKAHGFDVQEMRFGYLFVRFEHLIERLNGYLSGEVESIEELEDVLIDTIPKKIPTWHKVATASAITFSQADM